MKIKIQAGVVLCLLAIIAGYALKVSRLHKDLHAAETTRDSLFVEEAALKVSAQGWETIFGDSVEDLQHLLERKNEELRDLARTLSQANVRVVSLLEAKVILEDSLMSLGTRDTTSIEPLYRGEIDDGLLSASWRFLAPELSFGPYAVNLPVEIVTSRGGDGRWLITARGEDDRVRIKVDDFWIEPLPPVRIEHCSLLQRGKDAGVGGILGFILGRR